MLFRLFLLLLCMGCVMQIRLDVKAEVPYVIRVGYFAFDGYQQEDEDGNKSGYGYEFLQRMARYENVVYEYVGYNASWSEAQEMLANGEVDLITSTRKTPERLKLYDYSTKDIGSSSIQFTVKAGNDRVVTGDYQTYNGLTVGMLNGSALNVEFEKFATEHNFTYVPVYYDTDKAMTAALQAEEVDAALISSIRRVSGEWIIESLDEEPFYATVRKGDTETLAYVNDAIDQMDRYEVGWRQELSQKYYSLEQSDEIYFTQEEREYQQELRETGRVLTAVVSPERYPYSYRDQDGTWRGILVDVFERIAEQTGISYEILPAETQEEYLELVESRAANICIDMTENFSKAEQRGYKLTPHYLDAGYSWITTRNYTGVPEVAVAVQGLGKPDGLDGYGMEFHGLSNNTLCLKAVRSGEADGFYTNTYNAERIVFDNINNDLRTSFSEGKEYFCLGILKNMDPRFLSIMNKGARSISDTVIEEISSKYTQSGAQSFSLKRLVKQYPLMVILWAVCVILAFVLAVLLRHSSILRKQARTAQRAAEEASQAKTTFLSNMSHDIRTPINGIMGMIEIAEGHTEDPDRMKQCLKKMKKAADHLASLINDVLDMTRIEEGKVQLHPVSMDIREMLDTCCSITEGQMENRKLDFQLDFEEFAHPYVIGSELQIRQVLLNILNNAVKYTPDGGQIRFQAYEESFAKGEAGYVFSVEDTGIGMSRKYLEHIYEPFTQEREDSRTTYKGTGLGMAITKQLVDQMGGRLEVMSMLGVGSTFTLYLKLPVDTEPQNHAGISGEDRLDGLKGLKLLMAEDNELNREIAITLLEEEGAEVTAVTNGREAVEQISGGGSFDAVLMDIMMPELNGIEATKEIRAWEQEHGVKRIPIFAMTANVFAEDRRKCLEAGMDGHIPKPINMELIKKEICRLVR